jgi:hypothetical protein
LVNRCQTKTETTNLTLVICIILQKGNLADITRFLNISYRSSLQGPVSRFANIYNIFQVGALATLFFTDCRIVENTRLAWLPVA